MFSLLVLDFEKFLGFYLLYIFKWQIEKSNKENKQRKEAP